MNFLFVNAPSHRYRIAGAQRALHLLGTLYLYPEDVYLEIAEPFPLLKKEYVITTERNLEYKKGNEIIQLLLPIFKEIEKEQNDKKSYAWAKIDNNYYQISYKKQELKISKINASTVGEISKEEEKKAKELFALYHNYHD